MRTQQRGIAPERGRITAHEHDPFGAFVTALFTQRRKVLVSTLQHVVEGLGATAAAAALSEAGLGPQQRPQEVDPAEMLHVWRALGRPAVVRG